MAHKAEAETFVQGLLAAYGYMVVLAVFDTCFLDWILLRISRESAFPGQNIWRRNTTRNGSM